LTHRLNADKISVDIEDKELVQMPVLFTLLYTVSFGDAMFIHEGE